MRGEGWREENINVKCKTDTLRKTESTAGLTKNGVVQNTCSNVSSLWSPHWKEFKPALSKATLQVRFSWELFRPQKTFKPGIKCRKVSPNPWNHMKSLCLWHGTGKYCLFSRNLQVSFNSNVCRFMYLKQGLCYFKHNWLVYTEKTDPGFFICFNSFTYFFVLSQICGEQHQEATKLERPYSTLEFCCLNKAWLCYAKKPRLLNLLS